VANTEEMTEGRQEIKVLEATETGAVKENGA
jgi:hypothetical protein